MRPTTIRLSDSNRETLARAGGGDGMAAGVGRLCRLLRTMDLLTDGHAVSQDAQGSVLSIVKWLRSMAGIGRLERP